MIGLDFEHRRTSLNPAFLNAEVVPVQINGSGVFSIVDSVG